MNSAKPFPTPNPMPMPSTQPPSSIVIRRPARLIASLLPGLCSLAMFVALSARAQFSIAQSTIAGGGGTSTGGVYSVSGTMAQATVTVTPPTNGQYSVIGGFWVLPEAVQTVDAPLLTIAPAAPGYATISWAPSTAGFILQETWSLQAPASWTNSVSGAMNPVTIPTDVAAKFFRLHKP